MLPIQIARAFYTNTDTNKNTNTERRHPPQQQLVKVLTGSLCDHNGYSLSWFHNHLELTTARLKVLVLAVADLADEESEIFSAI